MEKSVLVTLTSPTAAGKSYLFNYIRDVAKLPCIISTTTRAPRVGEVEGVDYYFISEEESKRLEKDDMLAELAIYRGVRYGVTKQEMAEKLSQGLAFLIVEPTGIDHYVKPVLDMGALHYKVFVNTDQELRLERFKHRARVDLLHAMESQGREDSEFGVPAIKVLNTYMDRLQAMLTEELTWFTKCHWDKVVFGDKHPSENLHSILHGLKHFKQKFL